MQAHVEWRKVCDSAAYFIENYWWLPDRSINSGRSGGSKKMSLYDYQRDDLEWFQSDPLLRALILKGRQIGYSTIVTGYCAWLAMTHPYASVLYFSRVQRLSRKQVREMRQPGVSRLPSWMAEFCRITNKATDMIEFSNGATIEALASGDDPARGDSPTLVVLDEWPEHPNPDAALAAALPAAEAGQLIAMGTKENSDSDHYRQQWQDACEDRSVWAPRFRGCFSVPGRDGAWYDERRVEFRNDPPELFRQHPRTAEEAFFNVGTSVFAPHLIERHETSEPQRGELAVDAERRPVFRRHTPGTHEEDRFRLWRPPQTDLLYMIGVDVAGGDEQGDYSSFHVLDEHGQLCAHWHGWITSPDLAKLLHTAGVWYANALIAVEASGGWGDAVNQQLLAFGYPNVFHMTRIGRNGKQTQPLPGFVMSQKNKQALIDVMRDVLARDSANVSCADTLREMAIFARGKRKGTFAAPQGSNDDRVMSWGIAAWCVFHHGDAFGPSEELAEASPLWGDLEYWADESDSGGYRRLDPERRLRRPRAEGLSGLGGKAIGGLLPSSAWQSMNTGAPRVPARSAW